MIHARARCSPGIGGRRFAQALCVGVALLASCAPPPPRGLETLEVLARRGAERREHRFAVCEVQAALRVSGRATGRLPAVSLHARLATPERVRLQCRWVLGLLADVAVRGDTLTAWVPSERLGLRVPDLSDSLGVREPARFLARALTASWQAPSEAWKQAVADSAGVTLAWPEHDEQWTLRVDRDGRPREVVVARNGQSVRARYGAWRGAGPYAWPARVELADAAGWVALTLDLEDLHAAKRARPAWFALVLPDDARRLELDDVKRILSQRGGGR